MPNKKKHNFFLTPPVFTPSAIPQIESRGDGCSHGINYFDLTKL